MKLRQYQEELVTNILAMPEDSRTCVVAPTGAGKTVIFSEVVRRLILSNPWEACQALIIVDRDVLVQQTVDKLNALGIWNIGFIKSGYATSKDMPVQVGSVQSMARRQWWHTKSWKLIVLDEAHCTAFSKVGRWLVENLRCKCLGFTATPYRLSSREGMKDCFDNLLAAPIPANLQEMGFLSPMKYYSIKLHPALEKVRTVDGEFSQSDLSNACNSPQLIAAAVKEWKAKALDTPTLAFCVNVEHANAVAKEFLKNRISSAVVTGNTPTKERNRLYQSLTDGDIKVLASCMAISIGFDLPIAQTGLMLRPTKSKALHFQQIGRLMHPAPGKDFGLILDQAGNCRRHGLPESISAFRLDEQQEPLEHRSINNTPTFSNICESTKNQHFLITPSPPHPLTPSSLYPSRSVAQP